MKRTNSRMPGTSYQKMTLRNVSLAAAIVALWRRPSATVEPASTSNKRPRVRFTGSRGWAWSTQTATSTMRNPASR
jgi:hypothetical protein